MSTPENKEELPRAFRSFFSKRFNLQMDKADEAEIVSSISKNSIFVGSNLWTLIFAIIIASIGLNVNSTAVIIGAMLISPLMGPIMGIGLGIGTNDFGLVKTGGRNLLIATIFSIVTSTLYFYVTPLHDAQSELLARTTPSIWDVFIAFAGGLAGIIAVTRTEKSNVIPGVAIATALMPPLCTAGYGIANGNWLYFLGAIYLFFINCLFICISTYLIIRFLRFDKKHFEDRNTEKKVSRYILVSVLITILPSIYLAYGIVQKSIFENNAQAFINGEFNFKNTQVVSKSFRYSTKSKEIDLLLIGQELSGEDIKKIENHLKDYRLQGSRLRIRQGLSARQQVDFSQIRASILEDVFKGQRKEKAVTVKTAGQTFPDVSAELKVLFPKVKSYSLSNVVYLRVDSSKKDTITLFSASLSSKMDIAERGRMEKWIRSRIKTDSLKVLAE
ncbi:TIGR00341 family protein [Pedobacter sp. 22226]|uniref:TIGR00341 family protein n=1 Tax=Pedobacter sp. 22226 TaxID=3453894 RepID=UPI003F82A043